MAHIHIQTNLLATRYFCNVLFKVKKSMAQGHGVYMKKKFLLLHHNFFPNISEFVLTSSLFPPNKYYGLPNHIFSLEKSERRTYIQSYRWFINFIVIKHLVIIIWHKSFNNSTFQEKNVWVLKKRGVYTLCSFVTECFFFDVITHRQNIM